MVAVWYLYSDCLVKQINNSSSTIVEQQLCLENSVQTPLNFFWVDPKKNLEGFIWSFLSLTC